MIYFARFHHFGALNRPDIEIKGHWCSELKTTRENGREETWKEGKEVEREQGKK